MKWFIKKKTKQTQNGLVKDQAVDIFKSGTSVELCEITSAKNFYVPTYVQPESPFSRSNAQPVEGENWYTFGD